MMSRFRQANQAYEARSAAAAAAAAPTTTQIRASSNDSSKVPTLTEEVKSVLRQKKQALAKSIEGAEKAIEAFLAGLEKNPDVRRVIKNNRNSEQDHIAGEDSGRLNGIYNKMKNELRRLQQQHHGVLVKLGDRAPLEKMVKVWETNPHVRGGGSWVRVRASDVQRHQFWESLALEDSAHRQLMDRRTGDDNYRARQQEVAAAAATHEREDAERTRQIAQANYIIERRMVGMLASLHGVRCYHKRKDVQSGEWSCDFCDCTKVAPAQFVVNVITHPPGTFFLDDAMVNRQIDLLRAKEEASGAAASDGGCFSNPGGWGQPIESRDHSLLVHRAITRVSEPGASLPGDEAHTRKPEFQVGQDVFHVVSAADVHKPCRGVVRKVSYDLTLGGWVYDVHMHATKSSATRVRQEHLRAAPPLAPAAAAAVTAPKQQPSSAAVEPQHPSKMGCPAGCDGAHASHTVAMGPGTGAKKYGFFLPAGPNGRNFDGSPAFLWHDAPF
jgi:hypothetical protein